MFYDSIHRINSFPVPKKQTPHTGHPASVDRQLRDQLLILSVKGHPSVVFLTCPVTCGGTAGGINGNSVKQKLVTVKHINMKKEVPPRKEK